MSRDQVTWVSGRGEDAAGGRRCQPKSTLVAVPASTRAGLRVAAVVAA